MNSKAGTHRLIDGKLDAKAGTVPGLDKLVSKYISSNSFSDLVDEAKVIQGTEAIIDHLDRRWPERRLTPLEGLSASLAVEWEHYLDAEIGVSIRCWFYYHVLPERTLATPPRSNACPSPVNRST